MIYSLTITIAAAFLLLALFGFAVILVRRVAGGVASPSLRGWRWYPSPLGLLLIPLAGLLLFRFSPGLILIPIVFPFFWRGLLRRNQDRPNDGSFGRR